MNGKRSELRGERPDGRRKIYHNIIPGNMAVYETPAEDGCMIVCLYEVCSVDRRLKG